MKQKYQFFVCHGDQLVDGSYYQVEVLYNNQPSSVIVFHYQGRCLAYRNLCVHMPRRLDCEKPTIFDETGKQLRCSMHGILYNPFTGESISTICHGERLVAIKVQERKDGIWIVDKRVKPATRL